MSAGTITGPSLHVSASAEIGAPAVNVYRMIADYRNGHPRIVPPRYLTNLRVDSGGYGAGTRIRYDVRAFGTTHHARAGHRARAQRMHLALRRPDDDHIA